MFLPLLPQKFYLSVFANQQPDKILCPGDKMEKWKGLKAAVGSLMYTFYTRIG